MISHRFEDSIKNLRNNKAYNTLYNVRIYCSSIVLTHNETKKCIKTTPFLPTEIIASAQINEQQCHH